LEKASGELMAVNYSVKVRPRDNIDRVIKRFIKKTKKLGIIDEAKERRYYTKPSDKKRRHKKMVERRRKKDLEKGKK
jgi:ribosomal protein S21